MNPRVTIQRFSDQIAFLIHRGEKAKPETVGPFPARKKSDPYVKIFREGDEVTYLKITPGKRGAEILGKSKRKKA